MTCFLNTEQENWLYLHYPDMSNADLAEHLTCMVKEDNAKTISKLESLLNSMTDARAIRDMKRTIARLASFDKITPNYVRAHARKLHCPRKNIGLISESARAKAYARHYERWKSLAKEIDMPAMKFFRSLKLHETRVVRFESMKKLENFRSYMCNWNKEEGFFNGILIVSTHIPDTTILRFEATLNRASQRYGTT